MRKVHRPWFALVLILALPLMMAMGTGDSQGPTRIPMPETNYRVLLVDMGGSSVELTHFSIDSQVFALGKLGDGQAAVPFDKIVTMQVTQGDNGLQALLTLKDADPVILIVRDKLPATGKTQFGNFRIQMGEVSRVDFLGVVQPN